MHTAISKLDTYQKQHLIHILSYIYYWSNITIANSYHCQCDKIIRINILRGPVIIINSSFDEPRISVLSFTNHDPYAGEIMRNKQMNDK